MLESTGLFVFIIMLTGVALMFTGVPPLMIAGAVLFFGPILIGLGILVAMGIHELYSHYSNRCTHASTCTSDVALEPTIVHQHSTVLDLGNRASYEPVFTAPQAEDRVQTDSLQINFN